jgi:hypothetical protein
MDVEGIALACLIAGNFPLYVIPKPAKLDAVNCFTKDQQLAAGKLPVRGFFGAHIVVMVIL